MRSKLKEYQEFSRNIQAILHESIQKKDKRIWDLEEEIRSLREIVSDNHLDSRFWIGRPVGRCGDPHQGRKSPKCS